MTSHVTRLSLWIRLWHWLTALSFILLTITGTILHFGGPGSVVLSYDTATALHDVSGIFMSVLYGVHLVFMIGTGYWRCYIPSGRKLWARLKAQVVFYTVGSGRNGPYAGPTADSRFNVLQQLSYLVVVFALLPLLIVTGLLYLYYPALVPEVVLGTRWPVDARALAPCARHIGRCVSRRSRLHGDRWPERWCQSQIHDNRPCLQGLLTFQGSDHPAADEVGQPTQPGER